jgi:hypothetical protein
MGGAAAILGMSLCLAGCGLGERGDASKAIAKFLAAADKGDRAAFEAGIDRAALRSDLADQMADLGKTHGLDIAEAPTEFVLDRMIAPPAVRAAAARTAPGWPAEPTAAQIVPRMKVKDLTHVCLEEQKTRKCLLTFAKRDGAWRLVAMPASALMAKPLQPDGADS